MFNAYDRGTAYALWARDMLRLKKERSRWLGVVAQPLLFWAVIGGGIGRNFSVGGEPTSYLGFFYPGVLVMVILFTTIFSTISIIEDRQSGFLQGVMIGPGSRASVVAGKVAGVTTLVLMQCALFLLLAPAAGFAWSAIHWPALVAAIVLGCVMLTGITFIMAWALPSSQAYHAIMSVVLIPLWVVSGAMFPAGESWIGRVMHLNPMTWMVNAVRFAVSGGSPGAGSFGAGAAMAILAMLAAVSFFAAVFVAQKTPARRD